MNGRSDDKGSDSLKIAAKTILLTVVFFIFGIYYNIGRDNGEEAILYKEQAHQQNDTAAPEMIPGALENGGLKMPKEGLAVLIGKKTDEAVRLYGEPSRIDHSAYGYVWWVYKRNQEQYFQIGIKDEQIVTAYGIGEDVNVSPFYIGQPIDEIYSSLFFEMTFEIDTDEGAYRFELSEEDMNMRPLVKMGKIYVQLYLDKYTGTVSSIRYMDTGTLLMQRPYELTYRGELAPTEEHEESEWLKIEEGNKQQIFDITNIFRNRAGLDNLEWDESAAMTAYMHSYDMSVNDYFSKVSPTQGDLTERLEAAGVEHTLSGENIAAKYVDAIEAAEGWLNSKDHRETMLKEEFTHMGAGVYRKFYTQNFVAK